MHPKEKSLLDDPKPLVRSPETKNKVLVRRPRKNQKVEESFPSFQQRIISYTFHSTE